jgi:hypothetical protein
MSDQQQPRYLEKRIENPIDYYTYQTLTKFKKSIRNSELFQNVQEIVNRSEDKNTLNLSLFGKNFELSYHDRKNMVYGLTVFSMALHSMRNKLRFRTLVPYYVFWSSLMCRENLNPYI